MRLDPVIRKALEDCGAPWEIKSGGHHAKIYVNNRLAGILPHDGRIVDRNPRSTLNILAQIRRAAQLQRGPDGRTP